MLEVLCQTWPGRTDRFKDQFGGQLCPPERHLTFGIFLSFTDNAANATTWSPG